jgi:hypothetical protein
MDQELSKMVQEWQKESIDSCDKFSNLSQLCKNLQLVYFLQINIQKSI